jgi:signal transduction histidine kinase
MTPAVHPDQTHASLGADVASADAVPGAQQRARYDALRRRIFGEMGAATARWRLAWILPFHALVIVVLASRGFESWRVGVLVGSVIVTSALFLWQLKGAKSHLKAPLLFVNAFCFFAVLAMTGGVASPLAITGLPMLFAAGMLLTEPRWMKGAFFTYFFGGYLVVGLLSWTRFGQLVAPLTPEGGWSTTEYVSLALASIAFVAIGSYRTGCIMSRAYQQVAFELAERREELCTETEDRTRALEGMAARLAHEVKNPLAAIKGLSAHMARSASDAKMAERLAIVASEADRLQSIVDGFLSFSRGFDDLKVAPTKPHEIAREIILLLETRAADNGVALEAKGGEDITVNADGRKLRQAMLNLVLNAIQASPPGKTVTLEVARKGKEAVELRVSDEGGGMTPEVLERIRKPYFTTKEGGSGLGVAVARGLIEQHGGQLRFDSAPGRGTAATMDLPICSRKFCKGALPNPCRSKLAEVAKALTDDVDSSVSVDAPAR